MSQRDLQPDFDSWQSVAFFGIFFLFTPHR
jgi:hypothetical protein